MGTDIQGWVEYWDSDAEMWGGLIKLAPLVSDRNYELFAWLFGIRRRPDIPMRWNDVPIAAGRGLPEDASQEAAADYAADVARFPAEYYGVTWVTWSEIQSIDWNERIEDRIVESRRGHQDTSHDGAPLYGTYSWRSQFRGPYQASAPTQAEISAPGQRWEVGDMVYEVVTTRRRDVLEERWELLFQLMEALATRCEDSAHLRLVVWFDG